jgi:hypothetical protein
VADIKRGRVSGGQGPDVLAWTLRYLLNRYKESRGIERLIVMGQLRQYVKDTPYLTLLKELEPITEKDELNVMLGVGLKGVLYYAVIIKKVETNNV